jgi:hypothetical protein
VPPFPSSEITVTVRTAITTTARRHAESAAMSTDLLTAPSSRVFLKTG